jgi:hypothetical protein
MNARSLITLVLLITGIHCTAQYSEVSDDVTDITRVNLISPGLGYEKRIGKYQTLYLQGFLSLSGGIGYSSSQGFLSHFYVDPTLSLEYRYFYNFRSRQERGKRVDMNSSNYLSPFIRTAFSKRDYVDEMGNIDSKRKAINAVGVTWGLQRNFNSRLCVDVNIGAGYIFGGDNYVNDGELFTQRNGQFYIPTRMTLGFWLNKRK